jgi:hypothetical protein
MLPPPSTLPPLSKLLFPLPLVVVVVVAELPLVAQRAPP